MTLPDGPRRLEADLAMLAARFLLARQHELLRALATWGFDDLHARHGAVLAHLTPVGVRATELARLSGEHKQVIGALIDELDSLGYVRRTPDPTDRRAKLVRPTERGLRQMRAADQIVRLMHRGHAARLGDQVFDQFVRTFVDLTATRGSN